MGLATVGPRAPGVRGWPAVIFKTRTHEKRPPSIAITFLFGEKLRNLTFNSITPPDATYKQIPFTKMCAWTRRCRHILLKKIDLRSECVL